MEMISQNYSFSILLMTLHNSYLDNSFRHYSLLPSGLLVFSVRNAIFISSLVSVCFCFPEVTVHIYY